MRSVDLCKVYSDRFKIPSSDLNEWISVRFIGELTKRINEMTSYPFIILIMTFLAISSYFDKWIIPPGLWIIMAFGFFYLIHSDHQLTKTAEEASKDAIKRIRRKIIQCKAQELNASLTNQLEDLATLIENYREGAFRPFTKRPIFLNSLLLVGAMAVDQTDNLSLMLKLFV